MALQSHTAGRVTSISRSHGVRIPSKVADCDLIFPNGWQEKERRRAVFKMPDPWWNQSRDAYQSSARMLFWLVVAIVFLNSLLGKDRA